MTNSETNKTLHCYVAHSTAADHDVQGNVAQQQQLSIYSSVFFSFFFSYSLFLTVFFTTLFLSNSLARNVSLVLAGAEACSSSDIKGPGTEGSESEGECEPVLKYHDSSGGLASGVRPLTAFLQQLCVRVAECYAAVPLPWV